MALRTITDIANELGLSPATVSKVVNGKAEQYRIGKKTQLRVLELVKKYNYSPNEYAANLRSGKSNIIGLLVPSIDNSFFARIASDLNKELRRNEFMILFNESAEDEAIEAESLRKFQSRNIQGLIIAPCGGISEELKDIQRRGLPIVCIDRYFKNSDIPYVATDNFEGGYSATKYLIDHGHRNIACLQGDRNSTPNILRVDGYVKAMEDAGIQQAYIVGSKFDEQTAYEETVTLVREKTEVSAIFTLNNALAIGCLKALRDEGIKIPEDISIITFDDASHLELFNPPLTSISQPLHELSRVAVQILIAELRGEVFPIESVLIKPTIIPRDSVLSM